jgi:hypothetical protein
VAEREGSHHATSRNTGGLPPDLGLSGLREGAHSGTESAACAAVVPDPVAFPIVSPSSRERDAVIKPWLAESSAQGHEMELDGTSDANFARYRCRSCGLNLNVGHVAVVGDAGRRRFELIEAATLNTPCPGRVAPG